jgi:hypothetical protein
MPALQCVSEGLARRTTRRGLFGRGAQTATDLLLGTAAGDATQVRSAAASPSTVCVFPGLPCACDRCSSGGVCAKPCMFWVGYASGCWVTDTVTCCDCVCPEGICGCGSDYHNNPANCAP